MAALQSKQEAVGLKKSIKRAGKKQVQGCREGAREKSMNDVHGGEAFVHARVVLHLGSQPKMQPTCSMARLRRTVSDAGRARG